MYSVVTRPQPDLSPDINRQLVSRSDSGLDYINMLHACREDLKLIQSLIRNIDLYGEQAFSGRVINLSRLEKRYGEDVASNLVKPLREKINSIPGWAAIVEGFPQQFGSTRKEYWIMAQQRAQSLQELDLPRISRSI